MKKNVIVAFAGTLLLAAFAFSAISFKPASLHELKAKIECECKMDNLPIYCHDVNGTQWHYNLECR